jgi:translation initiation factor 2-alpha kinase 4
VIAYLKRLDVHCQVFINPLSTFKDVFFQGGIMFKCASDTKNPDILAAGGRYDSLIREHRAKMGSKDEDRHAVGFSLTSEKITASMKRFQKTGSKAFLKKTEDDESANRAWSTKRVSGVLDRVRVAG